MRGDADPTVTSANGDDLHRRAAQGGLWTMVGFGAGQALRFGSNLILTRLIPREAFGVMLLVQVVLQGLGRFSDIGIGPAIVQNKREDPVFLDTAWTLQAIRGVVLSLCAVLLAWPAAAFFEQPALLALVPFAGLSAFFGGLQSSKLHSANRKLLVGRLVMVNLLGQSVGLVVAVGWGLLQPSVWALAGGGVASAFAMGVLSHLIIPGRFDRFAWDRPSARAVMTFGKWVFISTLLSFFAMQSDRIVFGRLFPADVLGVYAIATLITDAPQRLLRMMTLRVDFPLYSQAIRDGLDLAPVFRSARRRVLAFGGGCSSLLLAAGPVFVDLFWPATYREAGWMVQILAVAMWFNTIEATLEAPLLARSEPKKVAGSNLAKVLGMLVLMVLGYAVAELPGALAGLAGSEVVRLVHTRHALHPAKLGGVDQDLRYTALFLVSAGGGVLAVAGCEALNLHASLAASAATVLVGAVWLPLLVPSFRRSVVHPGVRPENTDTPGPPRTSG